MKHGHLLSHIATLAPAATLFSLAAEVRGQDCASSNPADWPAPARPYFMLMFDTSSSMTTAATPNSCKVVNGFSSDFADTRNGAVRCAMVKTVRAFAGEVNFGLASFSRIMSGCKATCFQDCTFTGDICGGAHILVPMDRDPLPSSQTPNTATILQYGDNDCTGSVELGGDGLTPLGFSLQNLRTYLTSGFDGNPSPLTAADPACRSLNVILLTDGAETCGGNPVAEAGLLYSPGVSAGGKTWSVRVHVIDASTSTPSQVNIDIATAGHGIARGATSEAALASAFAEIIGSSVKAEVCDNEDNNCNGCVDEGYRHYCHRNKTPSNNPSDSSQCCSAARPTCIGNYVASITPTNPAGNPWLLPCWTPSNPSQPLTDKLNWLCFDPGEACDGVDNNCEGTTPSASIADEGLLKCGGHCPVPEICNGQDENCNGIVDEAQGSAVPYSLPGCSACIPSGEICDGCDNDCDGVADNGVAPVVCGLPAPANCVGTLSCLAPENVGFGKCLGGAPSNHWGTCSFNPQNEICDGVDNNCNGTIDEGLAADPCEIPGKPGLVYKDVLAESQCVKGQKPCNGPCAGWVGPSQEICDGVDNDCDGLVDGADPTLAGVGQPCGAAQGTCTKGNSACVNGVMVCQGGVQPQPETCDGLDNDCNGYADDGVLIDSPKAADKLCWNLPPSGCDPVCTFAGASTAATWCFPLGASCHALGSLATPPCALGTLGCYQGTWKCVGGTPPEPEVCDAIDNDCDGTSDNNIATTVCGSAVGECKKGTALCAEGVITCINSIGPQPEICDGKDNDCDGVADNGLGLGTSCQAAFDPVAYPGTRDKGLCKPGISECDTQTYQVVCKGGVGPSPEVCDGLDNDCDGQVDETGNAPDGVKGTANPKDPSQIVGAECGKSKGACKAGVWNCAGGQLLCTGNVEPQQEVCDCIDNDCDGLTDEDPEPGSSEPDLCSSQKVCVSYKEGCQCAAKCGSVEFPCPTGGYTCEKVNKSGTEPAEPAGNRCVTEPCSDCSKETVKAGEKVECAPEGTVLDGGAKPPVCVCKGQPGCHNPCYGVSCSSPKVCTDYGPMAGKCVADNCYNVPCQVGQVCNLGSCVNDPCKPNPCKPSELCKPNSDFSKPECKASCAGVVCKATEQCVYGKCVPTGCSQPCPAGQVCSGGDAGICLESKCDPDPCTDGAWCDPLTGSCGSDPCSGVWCPTSQRCELGQCLALLADGGTDADGAGGKGGTASDSGNLGGSGGAGGTGTKAKTPEDRSVWGLATGGGGCSCSVGMRVPETSGFALGVAVGLLALRRRRRVSCLEKTVVSAEATDGFGFGGGQL